MWGLILSLYVKGKLFKCISTGLRCQVECFSNIHLRKVSLYAYSHFAPKSCTARIVRIELLHSGLSYLVNHHIQGLFKMTFPLNSKTCLRHGSRLITDTSLRIFKMRTSTLYRSSQTTIKKRMRLDCMKTSHLCCVNDEKVFVNVFGGPQIYIFSGIASEWLNINFLACLP